MNGKSDFRHWQLKMDEQQVLHLTLDRADSSQNSLSQEVLAELSAVIDRIEEANPSAVVLRSGKPGSFIVGADISEFSDFQNPGEVAEYIHKVHSTFARLEALPMTTLAVIDGPCLGGGLELALAFQHRIASDEESTKIGLPEIKLGIHPGFGGSVRSIETLGAVPALQLMLAGRALSARKAKNIGWIDAAMPKRVLENGVGVVLADPPKKKKLPLSVRLASHKFVRPALSRFLKHKVARKANPDHYPAPGALIDLWKHHADDRDAMFREEAESTARLLATSTAQNLIRVFFLQTRLKSEGKGTDTAPVQRVHVIGAGVMGRDIASWCALQGLDVTLQDLDKEVLGKAVAAADKLFRRKCRQPHLLQAARDRLLADPDGDGVIKADLVIEAIVEDKEIKQTVLRETESRMRADALLASNTSSIPLEELAEGLARPGQFLGIHFFNPVALMPLVEVVAAEQSDPAVLNRASAFVRKIKHLPLPVKSAPGFLVNRILMPYLMAAVELVEKGQSPRAIDRAALDFGMPMGPLHLADKVGLDICLSVAKVFAAHLDRPVPPSLERMVKKGHIGIKSGRGFYRYKKGKPQYRKMPKLWRRSRKMDRDALTDALLEPLFTEARACLDEGVVESADYVDAGMIFGTGFAPFTGGPMHYLADKGR